MTSLTDRRSDAEKALDNPDYFSEIERAFVRRRGRNLLLSPMDWSLLEEWEKRGIPLKIVLATIEEVFDQLDAEPDRARSVRTLSYCKDAVESRFKSWREGRVGSDPEASTDLEEQDEPAAVPLGEVDPSDHVRAAASRLKDVPKSSPSVAELVETVRTELEAISEVDEAAEIERRLESLDERVDDELLKSLSEDERGEQRSAAESRLASGRSRMDAESFERARELLVRKAVREASGIPRFSLYRL